VKHERHRRLSAEDYNQLQSALWGESNAILQAVGFRPFDAYGQMLREPEFLAHWWDGAHEKHPEEAALLDSAGRAFSRSEPLPEMTVQQRARFALRLRLGSRIVRAISSRQFVQPKGWFPNKLRRMSEQEIVEWVLVHGWSFVAEVFDESLLWADEVEPPPAPSIRRPPQKSSGEETSSLSE